MRLPPGFLDRLLEWAALIAAIVLLLALLDAWGLVV